MRRRTFLHRGLLATASGVLTARSLARVAGANERVRLGLIGFGLIGRLHARSFRAQADAQIVAVADCYRPRREAGAAEIGGGCVAVADFRRVLERKDLDAVIVATPDHWHALPTMMACAAGKDVYVEKPLHLFVREGEWMQRAARRTGRVVQVGTQQRSGPHYQRARELLRGGAIGELVSVHCSFFRNIAPGIGRPPDSAPPADLDWEMLLGPAPARPYNPNRALYHFRWFWDTSGGQMTNLGHHSLDILHWVYDLPGPVAVTSSGGRRFLQDNGEVPDTQDAILEYPGFNAIVQIRECAAGADRQGTGSLVFVGTRGTMTLGRSGYEIVPDRKIDPVNSFARIMGGHPVGGPQPVPETAGEWWAEPRHDHSGDANRQLLAHARNFLDCVKSRRTPVSDLASSHGVSTACHLANLALRTGRKLTWEARTGSVVGDPAAQALLERPYRAPWDQELKALL